MRIRVQVLGGCTIRGGARSTIALARPYGALIGYVLTHRNRVIQRDELAGSIWSETDSAHARRCLSTAIWRMRRTLGGAPPLLTAQGDGLAFNWQAPAWVDAVAMEMRLQPFRRRRPETLGPADIKRLERGVQLYRGDFLAGVDDEWALIERQRLRDLYLDSLYALTLAHADARDWAMAIAAGRQLAQQEPLREDVHRLLMRAHLATGNRASAVMQFRECERALRLEIGIAPMPETLELHGEIIAGMAAAEVRPPRPLSGVEAARRRVLRARRILGLVDKQLDRTISDLDRPRDPGPLPA
jgi:DNA-binding SARP family transcriptional activator